MNYLIGYMEIPSQIMESIPHMATIQFNVRT